MQTQDWSSEGVNFTLSHKPAGNDVYWCAVSKRPIVVSSGNICEACKHRLKDDPGYAHTFVLHIEQAWAIPLASDQQGL
jgi:hypothetical protein